MPYHRFDMNKVYIHNYNYSYIMKSIHVILVKGDNTSYPIKVILYDVTVHFRHSVIETFIFIY